MSDVTKALDTLIKSLSSREKEMFYYVMKAETVDFENCPGSYEKSNVAAKDVLTSLVGKKAEFDKKWEIKVLSRGNSLILEVSNKKKSTETCVLKFTEDQDILPEDKQQLLYTKGILAAPTLSKSFKLEGPGTCNITVVPKFESLNSFLAVGKNPKKDEVFRYFNTMADMLGTMQSNGILFPDAKNSNWLITNKSLVIADSKSLRAFDAPEDMITTREIMAPETSSSSVKPVTIHDADKIHVYLLACNVIEGITQQPVQGNTPEEREASREEQIKRIENPELVNLLDQCINSDPAKRPTLTDLHLQLLQLEEAALKTKIGQRSEKYHETASDVRLLDVQFKIKQLQNPRVPSDRILILEKEQLMLKKVLFTQAFSSSQENRKELAFINSLLALYDNDSTKKFAAKLDSTIQRLEATSQDSFSVSVLGYKSGQEKADAIKEQVSTFNLDGLERALSQRRGIFAPSLSITEKYREALTTFRWQEPEAATAKMEPTRPKKS